MVVAAGQSEPRQRLLGRQHRAAELEVLAVVEPGGAAGERAAVAVRRVVAAVPPHVARGELEPQALEVAQRRVVLDVHRGPHLDDRRPGRHGVVTADRDGAVAQSERQRQHRTAVDVGGLGGQETERAVADREVLVADGERRVAGSGDREALAVGAQQPLDHEGVRAVEREAIRDAPLPTSQWRPSDDSLTNASSTSTLAPARTPAVPDSSATVRARSAARRRAAGRNGMDGI